jgi:hypothetical protein
MMNNVHKVLKRCEGVLVECNQESELASFVQYATEVIPDLCDELVRLRNLLGLEMYRDIEHGQLLLDLKVDPRPEYHQYSFAFDFKEG